MFIYTYICIYLSLSIYIYIYICIYYTVPRTIQHSYITSIKSPKASEAREAGSALFQQCLSTEATCNNNHNDNNNDNNNRTNNDNNNNAHSNTYT